MIPLALKASMTDVKMSDYGLSQLVQETTQILNLASSSSVL